MQQNATASTASYSGTIVLTLLLLFCLFLIAEDSFGADAESTPDDGKIEVVYPANRLMPYRERRGDWGVNFGLQYEALFPTRYRSKIDDSPYDHMFGDNPVDMIQGQLGLKYNFALGSIAASALLAAGSIYDRQIMNYLDDPNTPAVERPEADAKLQLTKMGASFTYIMDTLFPEPYIAPYIEGQIFKMDWMESALDEETKSGTTDFLTAVSAGVLIQLNWLDPASAFEAQNGSGLQNTYLDLFISQYNGSGSGDDPNFETDMNYGAGLRLEF